MGYKCQKCSIEIQKVQVSDTTAGDSCNEGDLTIYKKFQSKKMQDHPIAIGSGVTCLARTFGGLHVLFYLSLSFVIYARHSFCHLCDCNYSSYFFA